MARLMVTGAGGFVGAHLTRALRNDGHEVLGIGLNPRGVVSPSTDWLELDVRDETALHAALARERPEAIVHLAGQSSAGRSFHEPVETFSANVVGTWTLLSAARRAVPDVRVLVVGTGEVYGPRSAEDPATEDAPFRPVSPYAASKAVADAVAEAFHTRFAMNVVRTRSFSHTGPGQTSVFALPSFARQIAAIERGGVSPIIEVGNLEVVRDLLDVEDVIRAYRGLIDRGRPGAAYNVCSGEGVLLSDAVRVLVSLSKVPIRIEVDPGRLRPADVASLVGSAHRLMEETGWRRTRSLEDTLRRLLDSWRSNPGS